MLCMEYSKVDLTIILWASAGVRKELVYIFWRAANSVWSKQCMEGGVKYGVTSDWIDLRIVSVFLKAPVH